MRGDFAEDQDIHVVEHMVVGSAQRGLFVYLAGGACFDGDHP